MEQISIENRNNLYSLYTNKFAEGGYTIPPLFIIADILVQRYGWDRVSFPPNNPILEKIIEDKLSLESFEAFNIIIDTLVQKEYPDFKEEYLYININEKNFLVNAIGPEIDFCIHYPEIIITNKDNLSHTIKDLYVKMCFNEKGNLENTFQINRATYTKKEILNNYKHSHAYNHALTTGLELRAFGEVCLGSGPLSIIVQTLKIQEFDLINILNFLINLDMYLKWESLEGVPYRYIKSIVNTKGTKYTILKQISLSRLSTVNELLLNHLVATNKIEFILRNFCSLYPTIEDGVAKYKITCDIYNAQKWLTETFIELFPTSSANLFIKMYKNLFNEAEFFLEDFSGESYSSLLQNLNNTRLFYFKGQIVQVNISDLNTITSDDDGSVKTIAPELLYYIIQTAQRSINLKCIKNDFNRFAL